MAEWFADWLSGWLVGWLFACLAAFLSGCFLACLSVCLRACLSGCLCVSFDIIQYESASSKLADQSRQSLRTSLNQKACCFGDAWIAFHLNVVTKFDRCCQQHLLCFAWNTVGMMLLLNIAAEMKRAELNNAELSQNKLSRSDRH